jgi:hypothetical protein
LLLFISQSEALRRLSHSHLHQAAALEVRWLVESLPR